MTRFQQVVLWSLVLLVLGYLGRYILVVEARQFANPAEQPNSRLKIGKKSARAVQDSIAQEERELVQRESVQTDKDQYGQIDLGSMYEESSAPKPNFEKGPKESFSLFAMRNAQKIEAAAQPLREATTEEAKSIARTNLRKVLAGIFAADMDARRAQSHEIESRLLKLRQQLSNREKAKEHILDLQMEVLENDAGLSYATEPATSAPYTRPRRKAYDYSLPRGSSGYENEDDRPRYEDDEYRNTPGTYNEYKRHRSPDSYEEKKAFPKKKKVLEGNGELDRNQEIDSRPDQDSPDESPKIPVPNSVDTEPLVEQTFAGEVVIGETVVPQDGKKVAPELAPDDSAAGKEVSPPKSP